MNEIISYNEQLIHNNKGAFISLDGKILFTNGNHEVFAKNYCVSNDFNDIDKIISNNLTIEQLKLLKLWLKYNYYEKKFIDFNNLYSDFLVLLLSFDKVETVIRKCISTTCKIPHYRFYNYYLMDWNILELNSLKYNNETNSFEYSKDNNSLIKYSIDSSYNNDIKEIKNDVLIKDRYLFFK